MKDNRTATISIVSAIAVGALSTVHLNYAVVAAISVLAVLFMVTVHND